MMVALIAVVVAAAIILPHTLRLDGAPPVVAAVMWFCALALRAVSVVFAAVFVILVLPGTGVFQAVTHWCWHAVIPLLAAHLGLDGHSLGDAALLVPALVLVASGFSVAYGIWKTARAVGRLVRAGLPGGPSDSLIIPDPAILVAAAGLRRPAVVVSAGALTGLDDGELFASLEHEHGHIRRRHRWILVAAAICHALGRVMPGASTAHAELVFQLERDADGYAIRRHHAPSALASAICKAAQGAPRTSLVMTPLSGGGAVRRVRELLDVEPPRPAPFGLRTLATAMAVLVLALVGLLPSATLAAVEPGPKAPRHCVD